MAKRAAKASPLHLERGEGKARFFWEITRTKATLTTRFGKHLSEGRRIEKKLASEDEAIREYAALIEAKRKEGYAEPVKKRAPGDASTPGVMTRNPEIEAIIEADPSDLAGYLVYAGWLQQEKDVRGELIVIQQQLSENPDDESLHDAEDVLFRRFESELLGPLAKHTMIRLPQQSLRAIAWRYGFWKTLRLRYTAHTPIPDTLRGVLAHPSSRFLEGLVVGETFPTTLDDKSNDVFEILRERAPKTLTSLMLGDRDSSIPDLDRVWTALPNLERLVLSGGVPSLATADAPALEELVIAHANGDTCKQIASARWPQLRRLALTVGVVSSEAAKFLPPLFAARGLPSLEHLMVTSWAWSDPYARTPKLLPADTVALDAVRFAGERRLPRLDLLAPLTEKGMDAIAREPAATAIGSLRMPKEGLGTKALADAFAARLPNLSWIPAPDEVVIGDVERTFDTFTR